MKPKCTHDENRFKVCAPCGKKLACGRNYSELFLKVKYQSLIRRLINKNFQISDQRFPCGICTTCRLTLSEHDGKNFKRPLPVMPNYLDINLPKNTRTCDGECNCYICLTGRSKAHKGVIKGRGHKRTTSTIISPCNGLNGSLSASQSVPEQTEKIIGITTNRICDKCYQQVGKGIRHDCGNAKKTRDNIMQAIEKLPEKQQQQIASSILKRKLESSNNESCNSPTSLRNASLELSTAGRKRRVNINAKEKEQALFNTESLDNYRVTTNASANDMKKMTNFLRSHAGKKSVPPYYRVHVSEQSKMLDNIYKTAIHDFDTEKTFKEKRPVVYADASELLETVMEKRGFTGGVLVKLMLDGGQHFFKISLTILPEDYLEDSTEETCEVQKTRSLYSEGGSCSKKSKLTSVNKLILLCLVPSVKETYENIQILFNLTNVNNIPFKIVSDFKVLLLINGQQTSAATYPCPFCFITLTDMRVCREDSCDDNENEGTINEIHHLDTNAECLRLKSYGDLKDDYNNFESFSKNKKDAKYCHSTVNLPLLKEEDDVLVIEKCVVPELHLLQGFMNHLFWDGLVPLVGRDLALIWPKKLNVIPKNYHKEIFEGNACRKMLKNADALLDPEIYKDVGYFALMPFVSTCKAMERVVSCCFSTEVKPDLDKYVDELKKSFESTQLMIKFTETLKIHMILEHLQHSLHFLNRFGLGLWSEQVGESIHREFLDTWTHYKMNLIEDPSYAERLHKAVVEFSSLRI